MNNEQFLYWLQGMLEYTDVDTLAPYDAKAKLKGIKEHLKLVFEKKTPPAKLEPAKPVVGIRGAQGIKGVIEPDDKLKKAFEEAARNAQKDSIGPRPGIDPTYWLQYPSFQYTPDSWLRDNDVKPGTLYC